MRILGRRKKFNSCVPTQKEKILSKISKEISSGGGVAIKYPTTPLSFCGWELYMMSVSFHQRLASEINVLLISVYPLTVLSIATNLYFIDYHVGCSFHLSNNLVYCNLRKGYNTTKWKWVSKWNFSTVTAFSQDGLWICGYSMASCLLVISVPTCKPPKYFSVWSEMSWQISRGTVKNSCAKIFNEQLWDNEGLWMLLWTTFGYQLPRNFPQEYNSTCGAILRHIVWMQSNKHNACSSLPFW